MNALKLYWQKLSETGIDAGVAERTARGVRLLNRMNTIIVVIIALTVVQDWVSGAIFESFTLLLFSILSSLVSFSLCLVVFLLVRRKKFFIAKTLWFVFLSLLGLIGTYASIGKSVGIEAFMLIIIPLLALILYEDRNVAFWSLLIVTAIYLFLVWLAPPVRLPFPDNTRHSVLIFTGVTALMLTNQLNLVNQKFENMLSEQKLAIESQKNELQLKNTQITDSITYALRIQAAILPHLSDIEKALPRSFVLYRPKDIVAGDFYWFYKKDDVVLIAAADCTGHGVPGAFTSMLCSEKLNDAVKHSIHPGEILSLVNQGIKVSLKHTESTKTGLTNIKDGMDIALCSVNLRSLEMKYAGAYRPLWIIRNGATEVEEVKGTKTAIGGDTPYEQVYETHAIQLQPDDAFYIFSDGYADQDGGARGKKLMTKNFKQMLLAIQDNSMKEQKEYLERFIAEWSKNTQQLDDILVIGIRI